MLFSKSCQYGMRAMFYLSSHQGFERSIPIRKISADLKISFQFLTKILQKLGEEKMIQASKGPKGGVQLLIPPKEINLKSVVLALDGPGIFKKCSLGLSTCSDKKPCPYHHQWAKIRGQLEKSLMKADLSQAKNKPAWL